LALDPNRMYRILTSDFIAQGGSQFDTLSLAPDQIQILDTSPIIREGMVEALKSYRHSFTPSAYFDSKKPRQRIARICEEQVPQ